MYPKCCKKCGSISLHTEVKGNNTGLYCNDCGKWIKWLSKDELRAFNHNKVFSQIKDLALKEEEIGTGKEEIIIKRLKDFVNRIDKEIDMEYEKMPVSTDDAIRKNAYCFALEKVKFSICNILNGHDFNYEE